MPDWILGLVGGLLGGAASQLVGHWLTGRRNVQTHRDSVRRARQRNARANVELLMERIRRISVERSPIAFPDEFPALNRVALALAVIPDESVRAKVGELQNTMVEMSNREDARRRGTTREELIAEGHRSFGEAAELFREIMLEMDALGYPID